MIPSQKITAFDLDGTLAVSKSPLTDEMALLINKLLIQKKVVIISGGKFEQFEKQVLAILAESGKSNIENLIILPTSGSQRYEYDDIKKIWTQTDKVPLSQEIKEKARKLLEQVMANPEFGIPPNPTGDIIEDRDTQLSFSALGQMAPVEQKILWDPAQEKRQKIKAFLEPQLPELTIGIGGTTTLDLLAKGFDKAVGLERLLDKLGLHKADLLFVGDAIFPGGNDYSVQQAGFEVITITPNTPSETVAILGKWLG